MTPLHYFLEPTYISIILPIYREIVEFAKSIISRERLKKILIFNENVRKKHELVLRLLL